MPQVAKEANRAFKPGVLAYYKEASDISAPMSEILKISPSGQELARDFDSAKYPEVRTVFDGRTLDGASSSSSPLLPNPSDQPNAAPLTRKEINDALQGVNPQGHFTLSVTEPMADPALKFLHSLGQYETEDMLQELIAGGYVRAPPLEELDGNAVLRNVRDKVFARAASLVWLYPEAQQFYVLIHPYLLREENTAELNFALIGAADAVRNLVAQLSGSEEELAEQDYHKAYAQARRLTEFSAAMYVSEDLRYSRYSAEQDDPLRVTQEFSAHNLTYPQGSIVTFSPYQALTTNLADTFIASGLDFYNSFWVLVFAQAQGKPIVGFAVYDSPTGTRDENQQNEFKKLVEIMIFDLIVLRGAKILKIHYPLMTHGYIELVEESFRGTASRHFGSLLGAVTSAFQVRTYSPDKYCLYDLRIISGSQKAEVVIWEIGLGGISKTEDKTSHRGLFNRDNSIRAIEEGKGIMLAGDSRAVSSPTDNSESKNGEQKTNKLTWYFIAAAFATTTGIGAFSGNEILSTAGLFGVFFAILKLLPVPKFSINFTTGLEGIAQKYQAKKTEVPNPDKKEDLKPQTDPERVRGVSSPGDRASSTVAADSVSL